MRSEMPFMRSEIPLTTMNGKNFKPNVVRQKLLCAYLHTLTPL
jgi:hypothetical protein